MNESKWKVQITLMIRFEQQQQQFVIKPSFFLPDIFLGGQILKGVTLRISPSHFNIDKCQERL